MEQLSLVALCVQCNQALVLRGLVGRPKTKCDDCVRLNSRAASKRSRLARLDYYRAKQRKLNERRKPQHQEWLAANRDRQKAWWSRYYEENREQILARGKSYYQANRERFYAANALRRVRVRDGWHQLDAVDKQIVRFFYKAARKRGLAVDHIYPLDLGGEHAPWNLQLLTGKANSAKHNNEPTEREVVRGKRRYRLLRRQFERAANLGATA